jgi:addiction module HigA family antidote
MGDMIENEYNPSWISHPGETLRDILEERGISQSELALRTGRPKKTISEIVNGLTAITPETALQLESVFRIPANFWIKRQSQYDEFIAKKDSEERMKSQVGWVKTFPINDMIKMGWIKKQESPVTQLAELLQFFGINSPDQWDNIWEDFQPAFRQSSSASKNPKAVSAWLRVGELQAEKIKTDKFNKLHFVYLLNKFRLMTRKSPEEFEEELISECAKVGVALVFVPRPRGVPVCGATRWIHNEKALIQLSLRGKYEDIFWFTFFHEAAHIINDKKREIFIEVEDGLKNENERKADEFAQSKLIPTNQWIEFIASNGYKSKASILQFSENINISTAIIVGRLHHEKLIPQSHMNDLRRRYDINSK